MNNKKLFSELKDYTFCVPYQQRGYKWRPTEIESLLDDLKEFVSPLSDRKYYCLQPLAVKRIPNEKNSYYLLDGQQRLTSLYLIYRYITEYKEEPYTFEFQRDDDTEYSRKKYLQNIQNLNSNSIDDIDFYYIKRVSLAIENWFNKNPEEKDRSKDLLSGDGERKQIVFIWYEPQTDDHEVFRNLNSGKIQLTDAELIKASLLEDEEDIDLKSIAIQYDKIEQFLKNDRFWYMLQREADIYKSRIEFLMCITLGVTEQQYRNTEYHLFSAFSKCTNKKEFWNDLRLNFDRLVDLFETPAYYHYIGYLTYCGKSKIGKVLSLYKSSKKTDFLKNLKDEVKNSVPGSGYYCLSECRYDTLKPEELRRIYILYNIETILHNFEVLSSEKNLKFHYIQFPFDMLYAHNWNIEHIASKTDNILGTKTVREEYLRTLENDPSFEESEKLKIKNIIESYSLQKTDEDKRKVIDELVEIVNEKNITVTESEKDTLGNLVLLDV